MLLFLCRGSLYRFIPLNPDPNKAGKNWKHFSPLKLLAEKIRPQETLESPQPWSPFSVYVNRKGRKEKHAANRNKSTGLYVAGAGWNPTFTGGLPQAEGSLFFYPKDMMAGCTKQTCAFGELYPQFREKRCGRARYQQGFRRITQEV